jgi:hypothetical protein
MDKVAKFQQKLAHLQNCQDYLIKEKRQLEETRDQLHFFHQEEQRFFEELIFANQEAANELQHFEAEALHFEQKGQAALLHTEEALIKEERSLADKEEQLYIERKKAIKEERHHEL